MYIFISDWDLHIFFFMTMCSFSYIKFITCKTQLANHILIVKLLGQHVTLKITKVGISELGKYVYSKDSAESSYNAVIFKDTTGDLHFL